MAAGLAAGFSSMYITGFEHRSIHTPCMLTNYVLPNAAKPKTQLPLCPLLTLKRIQSPRGQPPFDTGIGGWLDLWANTHVVAVGLGAGFGLANGPPLWVQSLDVSINFGGPFTLGVHLPRWSNHPLTLAILSVPTHVHQLEGLLDEL